MLEWRPGAHWEGTAFSVLSLLPVLSKALRLLVSLNRSGLRAFLFRISQRFSLTLFMFMVVFFTVSAADFPFLIINLW